MRILTRYILREVLTHAFLGGVLFTFVLFMKELGPLLELAVRNSTSSSAVVEIFLLMLPNMFTVTIPMAVLLGILVGLGRLSADREFVAMQACGVSLTRLLRPVAVVSLLCWAATSYVLMVALPWGNRTFVERPGFRSIQAERAAKVDIAAVMAVGQQRHRDAGMKAVRDRSRRHGAAVGSALMSAMQRASPVRAAIPGGPCRSSFAHDILTCLRKSTPCPARATGRMVFSASSSQ